MKGRVLMADHMVKMSEVPKGQKFRFFIDYYGMATLAVIFALVCIIYVVHAFCQPKPDAKVLFASYQDIDVKVQEEVEEKINLQNVDFNGDGHKIIRMNYNFIDEKQKTANPEGYVTLQTKLMTSVGDVTQIFHILDEQAYNLFKERNAVGTYADIEGYETGHDKSEYIKIPLSEIPAFDSKKLGKSGEKLYLTLRPRANAYLDKEKNLINYNNHAKLLAEMMGYAPVN